MSDIYWAADTEKIADNIIKRVDAQKKYLETSGILSELRKSYREYYGNSYVENVDQSIKAMHINHYANLNRHMLSMITASRPSWEPRATNSDLESQSTTTLASGLLDYYLREEHIENKLISRVEMSLFLREGWISIDWNATGGKIYGQNPESGDPIFEGDVEVNTHTLLDITRDFKRRSMDHQWYIVRKFKNKYDLAAKYPEMRDKILALDPDNRFDIRYELNGKNYAGSFVEQDSDMVPTYTLYHDKSDAMPQGRLTEICSHDVTLFDGPLPYKRPYVICITGSQYFENSFGHSPMMDLLPIQDVFNMTVSAILTNQAANAIQNFQAPRGAAPKVTEVMDGMNLWEYDPKAGKVESMDLLRTAPEVFNFATFLQGQQELISGLSQISRGNAPATMSGTAMALLQQQAIQFSSALQLSYTLAIEQLGTALIELLQTFAVVPRIAQISGKMNKSMVKEFVGKDLDGITKVVVDSANPLTKTSAGRVEIANQLLQTPNMIKTPEQYIGVLTTGNLTPLYEHDNSQRLLMKSENEEMMDGRPVQALLTDDHPMHVLEHSCVLNSPEARKDANIVKVVLAHIQEHITLAEGMKPNMASMLKQASMYQAPPPPPQAPQGQGPAPVMDNQNPIIQQAEQTSLPNPAQPPQMPQI